MSDRSGRFTLIQQNDIHAQLDVHWELFRRGGREEYRRVGGLARAAAVANAIKQETDAALLVDCGDAIHGTLPAIRTEGRVIVPALAAEGVDLFVPGNWEYGFGPDALRSRAAEMGFPVLAANLRNAADGEPIFPATLVREIGGVRVGFVGLTSPIIPSMSSDFAAGLRFLDARDVLAGAIETLRGEERCDVVVLVSHLGFAQDVALVRAIDGVDVVLSGHTHNRLAQPAVVGGTLLIQSGFSGSFLGRLDLEVTTGRISSWHHELIELEESIEPDGEVQAVVDEQLAPFREEMDEQAGPRGVRRSVGNRAVENSETAANEPRVRNVCDLQINARELPRRRQLWRCNTACRDLVQRDAQVNSRCIAVTINAGFEDRQWAVVSGAAAQE